MAALDGYFSVACCKGRRGLLPGGVLICRRCDGAETSGTPDAVAPNSGLARDVPDNVWQVYINGREEPRGA